MGSSIYTKYKVYRMTHTAKFQEKFHEHFNKLPEESRAISIQRIKNTNGIPETEDISGSLPGLLTQDILMNIVDNVFYASHTLNDLVENGVPHKHVEKLNLTDEEAIAFHSGIKLATSLFDTLVLQTDVMNTFIAAVQEQYVEDTDD